MKILIPEGATEIEVNIEEPNYLLVLEFDDKFDTHHFWMKNGQYDGYSRAHECKRVKIVDND